MDDLSKILNNNSDDVLHAIRLLNSASGLINEYIRRYPHLAPELWDTMNLIKPYDDLLKYSQQAIEHHMEDLLQCIVYRGDITMPTKLEKFAMLAKVCQATTKSHRIYMLTVSLASDILGEPIQRIIAETGMQWSNNSQMNKTDDEINTLLSNKLPRYTPDRNRWYDRVILEVKQDILSGVDNIPDGILVPALSER